MRRLAFFLALLAALACVPAAAHAQQTRVHVDATFEFEFTTTWDMPEFMTYKDCYKQSFRAGKGSETVTLKTREPARMTFVIDGRYGTLVAPGRDAYLGGVAKLGGRHARTRKWRTWSIPSTCGGGNVEGPREQTDCGVRLPNLLVHFVWSGRLTATIGGDHSVPNREQERFNNCRVHYPKGSPGETWKMRPQRLRIGTVLNRKKFQVGDSQQWKEKAPAKAPPFSAKTKLKWTAKFTRVKITKVGR
jgi:hypothetical protein